MAKRSIEQRKIYRRKGEEDKEEEWDARLWWTSLGLVHIFEKIFLSVKFSELFSNSSNELSIISFSFIGFESFFSLLPTVLCMKRSV